MVVKNNQINQSEDRDYEIDLLGIVKILFQKRKKIFLIVGIFFLLGISISFLQPPAQFESKTTFLLKSGSGSGGGMGSLGGLASMAGIILPSGGLSSGSEIGPSLYPMLISSIEFKKALIQAPLKVNGENDTITYAHYFEKIAKPSHSEFIKKYTLGLPAILMSMITYRVPIDTIKKEDTAHLRLSTNEQAHFSRLNNQLKVESKDGIMMLSFSMPEPLMAAQMADFAYQLLQKEIINYKLGNLREELQFSESLYEEKKKEFEKIQNELGYFKDRNQNLSSSSVQNQMDRLEADYSLKLSIFTQVANALETIKLQIARDTPIFSTLDPVTIPNGPLTNNRMLIILFSTILGLLVSVTYILLQPLLKSVKEKWEQV